MVIAPQSKLGRGHRNIARPGAIPIQTVQQVAHVISACEGIIERERELDGGDVLIRGDERPHAFYNAAA